MNLRTYLMIKQAGGNPVNKLKLKSFRGMTDPAYASKQVASIVDRLGIQEDQRQRIADETINLLNNNMYGQSTIPDDVLANPGQALRNRGLVDKAFGNNDAYLDVMRMRRKGKLPY